MGLRERRERREQIKQTEAELKASLQARLGSITVSTLTDDPRTFEVVDVIWGTAAGSFEEALDQLKLSAFERDGDAVLGVGFGSLTRGAVMRGNGTVATLVYAYGTAVRWLDSPTP